VLVSPEWLSGRLEAPDVVVVDLRWREDGSGPQRFDAGHIPGARFCDWTTDLVDPGHRFAFMLASPERFAALMDRLGIGAGTTVVAYADDLGSGPFRLWWACRVFGRDQVRILDGGLDRWRAEGGALAAGPSRRADPAVPSRAADPPAARTGGRWSSGLALTVPATADDVEAARHEPAAAVVDSRPRTQFEGREVWFETGSIRADGHGIARTPRGPIRAGRVPWSVSVPAASLYEHDGTMRSTERLREVFDAAGLPARSLPETSVIAYCGVGISASALGYAALRAGARDARVYDASWDEWGRDPGRPVARGTEGGSG
jgi:thiosulfate/3-mercaptopyruvate sulfurtransferase